MPERTPRIRIPYDPSKHCGHTVNRDPEKLQARLDDCQRKIDELEALQETQPLSKFERIILARKIRMRHYCACKLKELEENGPDDRLCTQRKGWKTDHPGEGYCKYHCTCKGKIGGHLTYYARRAKDLTLQGLIDQMDAANEDLLDLRPELLAIRAKLKIFLDEMRDCGPETIRSFTWLEEQYRKTVETVNNKKFQACLTRETFDLVLMRMAEVLMKHITDPEILEKIQLDWSRITVETATKRAKALRA